MKFFCLSREPLLNQIFHEPTLTIKDGMWNHGEYSMFSYRETDISVNGACLARKVIRGLRKSNNRSIVAVIELLDEALKEPLFRG